MYPLVESIRLKDGFLQNQEYHQARMNRSIKEVFSGTGKIDLGQVIVIPDDCRSGVYKVRVVYDSSICRIEIVPYVTRSIKSLKVVFHESIDYHLKYTNRQILEQLFDQRDTCDDIIIVKNGMVTDSFAANLLFFDGQRWFTPSTPLLKGTKRQMLLDQGIIAEKEIKAIDIRNYQKVGLINAMIDFEEMPVIAMDKIVSKKMICCKC